MLYIHDMHSATQRIASVLLMLDWWRAEKKTRDSGEQYSTRWFSKTIGADITNYVFMDKELYIFQVWMYVYARMQVRVREYTQVGRG